MSTVPELTGPNYTLWASKSKSWLQSQGIAYVLHTLKPGEIQIVGSSSPAPTAPAAPAGTTGGTTGAAAATGATASDDEGSDAGSPSPHFIAAASGSIADWEKDNDKAMGVIKLRVAQAIGVKIENITTTRVMWDTLKNLYGTPGAAEIFQNFKRAMNVEIPRNAHPSQAIDLIKMYLTRISDAGANTEIPMYLQYMIVINKLPPDIYAYIIARITQDDVDDFENETLDSLRTHVVNTWEARGGKKSQSANATKITAIKRKGKPPVFEEQQQQRHKGGSSAWRGKGRGRGNWRGRGKRTGEQTRQKQQAQSMGPTKLGHSHVIHAVKFFKETPTITVTEPSTKDNAFKTARENGLKPTARRGVEQLRVETRQAFRQSDNSEEFQREKEESTKCLRMWEAGLVDMGDSDKENVDPNPRTLQERLQMVNDKMTQRWYSGEFDREYNDGLEDLDQMSASNSSGWSQAQSVTPLFEEISTSPHASSLDADGDADSLPDLITPLSSSLDMDVISLGSHSEEEMISENWNDGGYYSADDEPGRM
ncbi:hypothetical protein D9758_013528 [Tetrapyrgos nigripes]|uniref:Gag protein n=1 Tax=Tetrapyrgos nigripes TaxID=182062 RepID=A0A8H5FW79_9AGAR|nr:hypothetical protein D9758_013528 [Tetrapyrgos nigripes]